MGRRITVTEAVRQFSDLLNTIKFGRSRYTIVRGGKPVASLGPADSAGQERTLGELKDLLKKIPRLGEEAESFERDLKAAAKKQPGLPKKSRMGVILDTSVLIAFERGVLDPDKLVHAREHEPFGISAISAAELFCTECIARIRKRDESNARHT